MPAIKLCNIRTDVKDNNSSILLLNEYTGLERYILTLFYHNTKKEKELGTAIFERMIYPKNKFFEKDNFFFNFDTNPPKAKPYLVSLDVNPSQEHRKDRLVRLIMHKTNKYCKETFDSPLYSGNVESQEITNYWKTLAANKLAREFTHNSRIHWRFY